MRPDSSPQAVQHTYGTAGKLHGRMRGHRRQILAAAAPDDGVIDTGAAHAQYKITGGHVHIFDHLIFTALCHAAHAGHTPHAGTEFQIAFLFNENTPFGIQTVDLPDRGVFH